MSDPQHMYGRRKRALLLRVDNTEPFPLPLFADLLSALNSDYRKSTGRDLTLLRIDQGSILVQLIDWAAHANELFDFGKNVAELVLLAGAGAVALRHKRRKGAKSVLAIAELAAKSGNDVTILHQDEAGETILVHVTPSEGRAIKELADADRQEGESSKKRIEFRTDTHVSEKAIEKFLRSAAAEGLAPEDASDGLMVLLVEVVRALQSRPDGQAVLDRIRSNLEGSGHVNAAALLDQLIQKKQG